MGQEYWDRLKKTLGSFWKRGDELRCIRIYPQEGCTCQMCGHKPIKWNHVLRNLRTGSDLVVGRECINNYKLVTGEQVIFSKRYEQAADSLNGRYPNCVLVAPESVPMLVGPDYEGDYAIEEDFERDMYHAMGLDPDDPDFGELAAEGLDPDEVDWDSHDYHPD